MQYKFNKHLEALLPSLETPLKILVAVSGGADSMCLLDLLFNSNLPITVSIAHVNFHLRGEECNKDEALVRDWASLHNVELFVKDADTISYAKQNALSIEMAARELRYSWFEELRIQHGFDYIAVAHHANDNAETLLLNLARGAGINGICGMKELDSNSRILRPLLSYSRQDIENYAAKRSIPYRTDHTNLDVDFHRNRIRNIIMPQMEIINPSAIMVLNRNMRYFSQAARIVDDFVMERIACLKKRDCDMESAFLKAVKSSIAREYIVKTLAPYLECHISIEELQKERHCNYLLYEILGGYSFNSAQIDDFTATLQQRESRRILSETHIAVQERGYVKVYKKEVLTLPVALEIENFSDEAEYHYNNRVLKLVKASAEQASQRYEQMKSVYPLTLMLAADNLSFPLTLKTIEQGMKWTPFGMNGVKKLSDYLMDIKIDTVLKGGVVVIVESQAAEDASDSGNKNNPGNIICLPGLQISNLCKVTASTKQVLILSLV